MSGKSDTKSYVDLVNTTLLPKLKSTYNSLIVWDGDTDYYIDNMTDLNNLGTQLNECGKGSNKYNSALLYPYFYSMYLYQPEVKHGETLDIQYTKGNWYAPSVGELSRLIYSRGYSSEGVSFTSRSVRNAINRNITNNG
jgi:hypothetical protein